MQAGDELRKGTATAGIIKSVQRERAGDRVTAVVDGPAWSERGLMPHDSRYPLKVETAVQRAVTLLLPGVSTASEFIRYYALYAALAAFAEDRGHGRGSLPGIGSAQRGRAGRDVDAG